MCGVNRFVSSVNSCYMNLSVACLGSDSSMPFPARPEMWNMERYWTIFVNTGPKSLSNRDLSTSGRNIIQIKHFGLLSSLIA